VKTSRRAFLAALAVCAGLGLPGWAAAPGAPAAEGRLVYLGTYTGPHSEGIYAVRFNEATGAVSEPFLAAATPNPSFVIVHPNRKFVYAVDESREGAVHSFAIEAGTGKLKALNTVSTRGSGPCYISLDRSGRYLMAANYGSGSVIVYPVEADGKLGRATAFDQHQGKGANPERQEGPHAHWIEAAAGNKFVLSADLGLDQVLVYRFDDRKGTLTPNTPPAWHGEPGAGPRHFAFTPNGRFGYLASEMAHTVTALAWNGKTGTLTSLQTMPLVPDDFRQENTAAEIAVSRSGRFVYASDRGHDSISVFSISPVTGRMRLVERAKTGGKEPRNFALDPSGRYLFAANQNSDLIVIFRVDPASGRLTPTGAKIPVGSPVCVAFMP
jgi:6-phosphogluconolactonase